MKILKSINFILFLIFSIAPLFVIAQTKVMGGGGIIFSKIESFNYEDQTNSGGWETPLGSKNWHPTVSASLEHYFHSSFLLSANINFGNNEIPYYDRSFIGFNALKFNQLSTSVTLCTKVFNAASNGGFLKNLTLGVGFNADQLYRFELGFSDQDDFSPAGNEFNQINFGVLLQAGLNYKNFKINYLNNIALEKTPTEFQYIKTLNWSSISAGYLFILND